MLEVGENDVVATEMIPTGSNFRKVDGKLQTNTDFETLYGFGDHVIRDLIFLSDGKDGVVSVEPTEDSRQIINKISPLLPTLPPVSFKSFKEMHRSLIASEKESQHNSEIVHSTEGQGGFYLRSTRDIESGEKIILKFSKDIWLRHQLLSSENPFHKIILFIFLETFKSDSLPQEYQAFDNFFIKWKNWTDQVCGDFLTKILKADMSDQFLEGLNCQGYSSRTVLYRVLQTVGATSPPSGSEYKKYPEALRNLTHQSRDLCFWPVQIAEDNEQTETLRRKMFAGLEFGPNATWRNFPKTKQVFMSARRDDLGNLKDVVDHSVNLNAYGSSKYWTPLHVACFYGSQRVAKYLLEKKVIFNSKDRYGKTPLDLAEENGHSNLAKLLIAHTAAESTLLDARVEIRKLPSENDPKMSTLEAAENCKNVGNNAFKNKNYKSAFNLYSRGLELCPDNHPLKVILLSNRAQVLITVRAYNLALRDINIALEIDPVHDKTILRRAHCYEDSNPARSLMDLDLLLYISVPDKFIHNRRNELFLRTLLTNTKEADDTEVKGEDETSLIKIGSLEFTLDRVPMAALMDLSLDDLRDLDTKVGVFDCKQENDAS